MRIRTEYKEAAANRDEEKNDGAAVAWPGGLLTRDYGKGIWDSGMLGNWDNGQQREGCAVP